MSRPPSRTAIKKAAIALFTLAAALGAGEWLCRLSFRKNIEALKFTASDQYYYYDRAGFRRHIPNRIGYERMWNDQGKAEFRINSLGFRGPEIEIPKPAGITRVLMLGDSITLGGRLPLEDTFTYRLQQELKKTLSKAETVNAGVGDVGLIEEEATLRGPGLSVQPDLIVLCWYLNDARPPVGFPQEVVYGHPLIRWFNNQDWLRHSYLAGFAYDSLRKGLAARQVALMNGQSHRFDWAPDYMTGHWQNDPAAFLSLIDKARFDWGDAWNDSSLDWMAAKISALRDLAASKGIPLAVVAMPEQAQAYAHLDPALVDRPQRRMAAFAAAHHIPFLDLLPELRAKNNERLFYDNCHYTPTGNAVVAEAILRFLKRERLFEAMGKS